MSLTDDEPSPTNRPEEFWSGRIESLSSDIRACQGQVARGDRATQILPGISLQDWMEMLKVDLLQAVVERDFAQAHCAAEHGGEFESLDSTLARLKDLLPDLQAIPEVARMTPEEETAWEREHRGPAHPRDTLSAEQRRKLQ